MFLRPSPTAATNTPWLISSRFSTREVLYVVSAGVSFGAGFAASNNNVLILVNIRPNVAVVYLVPLKRTLDKAAEYVTTFNGGITAMGI